MRTLSKLQGQNQLVGCDSVPRTLPPSQVAEEARGCTLAEIFHGTDIKNLSFPVESAGTTQADSDTNSWGRGLLLPSASLSLGTPGLFSFPISAVLLTWPDSGSTASFHFNDMFL